FRRVLFRSRLPESARPARHRDRREPAARARLLPTPGTGRQLPAADHRRPAHRRRRDRRNHHLPQRPVPPTGLARPPAGGRSQVVELRRTSGGWYGGARVSASYGTRIGASSNRSKFGAHSLSRTGRHGSGQPSARAALAGSLNSAIVLTPAWSVTGTPLAHQFPQDQVFLNQ